MRRHDIDRTSVFWGALFGLTASVYAVRALGGTLGGPIGGALLLGGLLAVVIGLRRTQRTEPEHGPSGAATVPPGGGAEQSDEVWNDWTDELVKTEEWQGFDMGASSDLGESDATDPTTSGGGATAAQDEADAPREGS